MSPELIYTSILLLVIIGFVFSQILEYLNIRSLYGTNPDELSSWYSAEQFQKSISYHSIQWKFGFWSGFFGLIVTILFLETGFYGILDGLIKQYIQDSTAVTILFFGIIGLISILLQLPFDIYDTFVIEEKFGFNKTDLSTFITDRLKGILLAILIGLPLLWVFLFLIEQLGQFFWIWFGLVATGFILFMNLFYTSLLLPLFNKLTPLEDGELKKAILDYSSKVQFPVENILVMDGSKRSNKANAFFSGFGKRKKIVLFDTLIEKHSVNELVAVLAHEVGHYKRKHIILGFISSVIQIFFTLSILSLFIKSENLSLALGGNENAIHLNLLAFGILFSPISDLIA